ncbi:proline racemase family [Fusarium flagelliforme]|uniref:Proline racemase n=1 Tax=Fusarium flagelliforme TaxID=2675880 RepID=A0A395MVG7_9HYPO|nr:proline racemase family [Fusarium flagelliforme]KAH7179992.1 proline racemase family [Fusarium flagelliforme]RFN51882.1 proline racemase [Fusarium flagelliforme]
MRTLRYITIVGCHAEGEVGDVIVGGVRDVPGKNMYEKLKHCLNHEDELRQLLLNEPRGRSSMNTNLLLPPADPRADAGFLIMESTEYAPMSGSNSMCTATVLLETGMVPMKEPVTKLVLDTAAGLITATAQCEAGKCKSVSIDNVPSFVNKLDLPVQVPGLGTVLVDIAWGGMWYAIVKASSLGLKVESHAGARLVEVGERIKIAIQAQYTPIHPENPDIRGVTVLSIAEDLEIEEDGSKAAKNTVVVSPGRLDRSPCGTGTCARMAVLHARGQLRIGETFKHRSIIGTEFISHIRGTTQVGEHQAVLPTIQGRAWITSHKQVVLDPSDPFPTGFQVGDQWHVSSAEICN